MTSRAIYQTSDGLRSDIRPAFEVPAGSSQTPSWSDTYQNTVRGLPWWVIAAGFAVGGLGIPVGMPVAAWTVFGAGTSVAVLSSLEEVVNREVWKEESLLRGEYRFVGSNGRVIPSAPASVKSDLGKYVTRHIRDPSAPSIFQGLFLKTVTRFSFKFWKPALPSWHDKARYGALGLLAPTLADKIGRGAGSYGFSSNSGGGGGGDCRYAYAPIGNLRLSNPGCLPPLQPTMHGVPSAPAVVTPVEAVALQLSTAAPEAVPWRPREITITQHDATHVTVSPPPSPSSSPSSSTGTSGSSRTYRSGPTSIELTGDFGGFRLK